MVAARLLGAGSGAHTAHSLNVELIEGRGWRMGLSWGTGECRGVGGGMYMQERIRLIVQDGIVAAGVHGSDEGPLGH